MTDKVVPFPGVSFLDLPVERILDGAMKKDLESVVVLGWTQEGDLYFAASQADGGDVLWLLKKSEKMLLDMGPDDV
jgi:hypothetical protein